MYIFVFVPHHAYMYGSIINKKKIILNEKDGKTFLATTLIIIILSRAEIQILTENRINFETIILKDKYASWKKIAGVL